MLKKLIYLVIFINFFTAATADLPAQAAFFIPEPIPGENQSIEIFGSTVKIKGLTDQANTAWINDRQIPIQKDGSDRKSVV